MSDRRATGNTQSPPPRRGAPHAHRGRDATRPQDIPAPGWRDVALRTKTKVKEDNASLLAAGVTHYLFLALFPGLTAFLSVYGLVTDPAEAEQQLADLAAQLPAGAGDLIVEQGQAITGAGQGALTTGLVVSLLLALWSASSGMHGLMQALTIAYQEDEGRGFVKRRALALALTIGAVVFFAVALLVVAVVPAVLNAVGLGGAAESAIRFGRWPLIALVLLLALAVVYRYGPDRETPQWQWVGPGSILAVILWIVGSIAFSIYVTNFGDYNETYGAVGAVVVLLLWLFLSSFIVLLGAMVNAQLEHQTRHDSTTGDPQPLGRRGAEVADEVGQSPG